jgi:hypothetical protein
MDLPKTKIPPPDFRPLAFRTLKQVMGEADAGMQWIEVALRDLKRRFEERGFEALLELAKSHGVGVRHIRWTQLTLQCARLQIVTAAQHLETFLDDLKRELGRPFRARESKEDLVSYTLESLNLNKHQVGELQYDVIDYYRLVRNELLHQADANPKTKLVRMGEGLRRQVEASPIYRKLAAPSSPRNLTFDDFALFTWAVKDFSKLLCSNIVVTHAEVVGWILNDKTFLEHLRFHMKPRRQKAAIISYIRHRFNLESMSEEISDTFIQSGLLAQR